MQTELKDERDIGRWKEIFDHTIKSKWPQKNEERGEALNSLQLNSTFLYCGIWKID